MGIGKMNTSTRYVKLFLSKRELVQALSIVEFESTSKEK